MNGSPKGPSALARQLLTARARGTGASPAARHEVLRAAVATLSRWIGASALDALMNRAVAITQPQHAITADLRQLLHKDEDTASEMARLADVHGEERVNAGIEALLVALLELLSRLIGDEMSARILDALPTAEDPRALKESE